MPGPTPVMARPYPTQAARRSGRGPTWTVVTLAAATDSALHRIVLLVTRESADDHTWTLSGGTRVRRQAALSSFCRSRCIMSGNLLIPTLIISYLAAGDAFGSGGPSTAEITYATRVDSVVIDSPRLRRLLSGGSTAVTNSKAPDGHRTVTAAARTRPSCAPRGAFRPVGCQSSA
jgi:hypothetical protein